MAHYTFALCVLTVLPLTVLAQNCTQCGDSGACCTADEECVTKENNGTCHKLSDRMMCGSDGDSIIITNYYCFKPQSCCDSWLKHKHGCCPEGQSCCESMFKLGCCPKGHTCCGSGLQHGCCPEGQSCCGSALKHGCCPKGTKCCRGGYYCCNGSNNSSPVSWALPFVLLVVSRLAVGGLSGHNE